MECLPCHLFYNIKHLMNKQNTRKKSSNTLKEYYSDIAMARGFTILNYIRSSDQAKNTNTVLYAVGSSFKNKKYIDDLSKKIAVEVKINHSLRHGLVRFLPVPTPRDFVIKIVDVDCMVDLFNELDDYLLIEYLLFNSSIESSFLDKAKVKGNHYAYQEVVKRDSQYLIYGIDSDNQESDTGIMEFVSYGINTPGELTCFL